MKRIIALSAMTSTYVMGAGEDLTAPVPAGPENGQDQSQQAPGGMGFPFFMLILMLVFMYFVLIRPQNKEQRRRRGMMDDLKVGDMVVTIGGLHGEVARKGENDIDLKVAENTVMTFNLGAVNQVVKDGEKLNGQE